jgi:hypothetical protein
MSRRDPAISLLAAGLLLLCSISSSLGEAASPGASPQPAPSGAPSPAASSDAGPASPGAAGFTSTVDNPWFPLIPGTTMTYTGIKDEHKVVEQVTVTDRTVAIADATCVVVEDTLSIGGTVTEKNLAYYAQDRAGNVWLFGEDLQEIGANGQVVSTDGSWKAGLDGAPPSLFMEAAPVVGDAYDHTFTASHSEVVQAAVPVGVPFGSFAEALVIAESSPDEPGVIVHKYYVRGQGLVRDVAVRGPAEELVLVDVHRA